MKKQVQSLIIKIAGSALIISFLISRIDWDLSKFTEVISNLNITWFLFSLGGVIIVLWLKSIRWNLLLKNENCNYPFYSAFTAYMASFTIGLITPGRLGEISRLYYLRSERDIDFFHSFKTIVIDRIFDFTMLFWFGISGLMIFYRVLGDYNEAVYLIITAAALFFTWYILSLALERVHNQKTVILFLRDSWNKMMDLRMVGPWLLTFLAYGVFYFANWLILISIGHRISLIDIGFILSLMSLVTLIPITIAGFGTREVSLVFLLSFYSIGPETAIVFSILQFIAFFFWGGIIGMLFWIVKPVNLSLIKQDASAVISLFRKKSVSQ